MDPDSRWILREMVSRPVDETLAAFADDARSKSVGKAKRQRVQGLLVRHSDGDSVLESINALGGREQHFVIHWIDIIARSDTELARAFAARATQALALMDAGGVEAWLTRAMDAYDKRGLGYAISVLEDLDSFAQEYAERHIQVSLEDELSILQPLIIGLGGRPLTITLEAEKNAPAYTDSEKIYLPERARHFQNRRLNRQLLMVQAVYLWAQNRYGTWQLKPLEQLSRMPASAQATGIYAHLECYRLETCLARELPGLARRLRELQQAAGVDRQPPDDAWQAAVARVTAAQATAEDSLALIETLRDSPLPAVAPYMGIMYPDRVRQLVRKRVAAERERLQRSLRQLEQRLVGDTPQRSDRDNTDTTSAPKPGGQFSLSAGKSHAGERQARPQLEYQGRKVKTPADVEGVLTSIEQDLGEVPEDYLVAAGDTPYDADAESARDREYKAEPLHYAEGALSYPEWDYNRQRYRQDYCLLHEQTVKPGNPDFIQQTLQKYRGPLKSIRRSFEAVLGEDRLLRRQAEGDDIDIDALIEAQADLVRGAEMDDRVYSRHRRVDRDIAVMFMVDMSGSTRGWINEAEREALVLLCEALETLGDRYAIYGFSGRTHTRCAIYHIKRFDEAYSRTVRDRISGIKPQTYTRMGVAIRHLSGLLRQVPARTKLLVTLSDGKPEDYGSYRGRYGIEDTRKALIESRRDGIHAFCITIDKEGGDYLPHMYGPANYAVIDQVSQLPLKVADIYRRLTT